MQHFYIKRCTNSRHIFLKINTDSNVGKIPKYSKIKINFECFKRKGVNQMLSSIHKLIFNTQKRTPRDMAKERLKIILESDKTGIKPYLIGTVRDEILRVVSNHIEINESEFQLNFSRSATDDNNDSTELVASIPLKSKKILF